MENFQTLYKCVALLVLVACHEVLVIEGRKMKSTEKKQDMSNIEENDRSFENYSTPRKDDTYIDRSSVASRKKETSVPPLIPNYHNISFGGSESARKEYDFRRSTAPGNSPGVGHAFPDHEADVDLKAIGKSQLQGVKHSVINGFKYDYRPTAPGHSPGVGHHVLQSKKLGEPNA